MTWGMGLSLFLFIAEAACVRGRFGTEIRGMVRVIRFASLFR